MISRRPRGFTLVEVLVTLGMVAIITAVAVPAYSGYVTRSKVPTGLDSLAATATRMEQFYQDTGSYGTATCGNGYVMPTPASYNQLTCTLLSGGQGFELKATGTGSLSGYVYSINHKSERKTLSHPNGLPSGNCWSVKGTTCDAS